MADESPNTDGESSEEEPAGKETEPLTLDREILSKLRNKRPIAVMIVVAMILLLGLKYANNLHDEVVKVGAWLFAEKKTEPATFAVRLDLLLEPTVPLFYIVRGSSACAAPVVLSLSVTNLQTFPVTIFDYTVEAQDNDKKWVKLPKLPMIKNQQIYADTPEMGLASAALLDKVDPSPLDLQLTPTSILQPHVPLVGIAFFDNPFPHIFSDVRVTIQDTLGNQFTSDTLYAKPSNLLTALSLEFNTHKRLDLKKLYINDHCGR